MARESTDTHDGVATIVAISKHIAAKPTTQVRSLYC
jgi:hypothetical protein